MYKVIGVDEAGKGPVIGSMFIGFSIINLQSLQELNSYQEHLAKLGVIDSKKLSSKKRASIYENLKENLDMKYVQLVPHMIDSNNKNGGKLNDLEVEGIIKILESERPNLVILDALTATPEKFAESIRSKLSFECKIMAENKADSKYEMVAAASIIAKELREKELQEIRDNIGLDCGSGYPSDPKTRTFLQENWNSAEFGFIFRKSWQSYKDVAGTSQKTLDEYSDKQ